MNTPGVIASTMVLIVFALVLNKLISVFSSKTKEKKEDDNSVMSVPEEIKWVVFFFGGVALLTYFFVYIS